MFTSSWCCAMYVRVRASARVQCGDEHTSDSPMWEKRYCGFQYLYLYYEWDWDSHTMQRAYCCASALQQTWSAQLVVHQLIGRRCAGGGWLGGDVTGCNRLKYLNYLAFKGFRRTKMTESPLRNILLMYLSLLTACAFFLPLPVLGTSVHISFTCT